MVGKLEDTLLRCKATRGRVRETLFRCLDDATLRVLRSTSRVLHQLVNHQIGRLFRELYVNAPFPALESTRYLESVAPLCYNLTVKVGHAKAVSQLKRPSFASSASTPSYEIIPRKIDRIQSLFRRSSARNSSSSWRLSLDSTAPFNTDVRASIPPAQLASMERLKQMETRQQWTALLSRFRQMNAITIRVNGDPVWPGRTEVEDMLVDLRIAIESANLPQLRTVYLAPIHAMGIVHFRWQGFGIFGEVKASGAAVWMNIDTLDLRVYNPSASGRLSQGQEVMFKKIMYDYLHSFAPSLRCLRFVWLGSNGPSPMMLHLDPGLVGRSAIIWPNLKELWIGNVKLPHQTTRLAPKYAPSVSRLKVLRSTRRDSSMDANDSSAWVEVVGARESTQDAPTNRASSVYSQSALSTGSAWAGGISRSSRDLQFMLDI